MCTVTLSYDKNNEQARQQLAALIASGLFLQLGPEEDSYVDEIMKGAYDRVMQKDAYTLEEAYKHTMGEIKAVYDNKYAI